HAFGPDGVLHTRGTQNNLVGLPLTLLRLGSAHSVAVLELGMNGPGEGWRLAGIADPAPGVITLGGPRPPGGRGSLPRARRAGGGLFGRLGPSATAVVNADDPLVVSAARSFPGRVLRFGTGGEVRADEVVDLGLGGSTFRLCVGTDSVTMRLPVPGRHNVGNA